MDAGSGASSSGSSCGFQCGSATEISAPIQMPVSIQRPKIIFILDNISLRNYVDDFHVEFDETGLPQAVSEITCDAYVPVAGTLLGRVNKEHKLFLIPSLIDLFSLLTSMQMHRELFETGMVVEQHVLATAQRIIPCDTIQSLVDRLPANSLKIGCLSGDDDGGDFVNFLNAATNGWTLVFVVGEFAGREMENHIDYFVKVSGHELTLSSIVSKVCIRCMDKWGIM